MDQSEALGALVRATDDESGDLHHLSMSTGCRSRLQAGGFEMLLRSDRVTGNAGDHRKQRVVNRVHVATIRRRAYSALTYG